VPPKVKVPLVVIGPPERVKPVVPPEPETLVTVPVVLLVPAPMAVLKLAASSVLTELSALILINVTALGLVRVNRLPPTVVAPKLVRAPLAVVAPVPPLATAIAVPFQTPLLIVPKVVMLLLPAQVLRAVFSTLARPTLLLARLVIQVGSAYEPLVRTMLAVVTPLTAVALSVPPLMVAPFKVPAVKLPLGATLKTVVVSELSLIWIISAV
jgi:hypothetical protein